MEKKEVVTVFLFRNGKVLLLRRSDSVSSYQGCWAGVSGYLEETSPLEQALRELGEETSLAGEQITCLTAWLPLAVKEEKLGRIWIVHPFLFRVEDESSLHLDREHTECKWVTPEEVRSMETVPMLYETLQRVLPL